MSGELKIRVVALSLVVVAAITVGLMLAVTGGVGLVPRVLRLVVSCIFAYFLVREALWARWLIGVSAVFAVVLSIIGWLGLNHTAIPMFSIVGIWMLVMAVYYGWVAYMLLFDRDIARVFNPGAY